MVDTALSAGKAKVKSEENKLALNLAKAHRLCLISKEEFKKMETLKPLGVKFELTGVRTNAHKEGREPFAYKVKMSGCTFIIDN